MNHAQDLGVRSIDSQCSHNIWANCERGQGLYIDPMPPYNSKLHVGPDSLPHLLSIYQSLNTRQEEQQGPRSVSFNRRTNPQTIFELLCLQDSSSGFPFTNLWGPEDGPEKVLSALPEDETLLSCFRFCRYSLFRILPSIIDFPRFETTLNQFLEKRSTSLTDALSNPPVHCTPSWFAVLFGILACGVQLSSSQTGLEVMKARVFGKAMRT
ncbi:uncharacterized protein PV06_02864 [Exophiala oligosperma]|uniref:Transcription factor domain-containing protein n=1 Tax=Exophiala oligosperma TaxID=215243 RepID=A0A0D2DW13_9EURO|nr:uncharacterized protein PV06_02864 [Exophiala oligosperma]KIW47283.1 hypothetical protein PV06_02864 [Exophiala oligosperma]